MKILLVDDERRNIELMEVTLQPLNARFESAGNGHEALAKAQSFQPDIVLLDVMMPAMDGYEVCARLKQDPTTQHIPVIMISALANRTARLKGLGVGADDFLAKPVDGAELLAKVGNFVKAKDSRDVIACKNAKLERLSHLKNDLTDMLIHDLRVPLSCIQGYLQMATTEREGDTLQACLARAEDGCEALLDMLNILLDIGRMEHGTLPLLRSPVKVADLLRRVRDMFQPRARNDGKQVIIEPSSPFTIAADPHLLSRVLQNLIANALRHVDMGRGEIRLSVQQREERAFFAVADNGRGIPAPFQSIIFDKFVQVEKDVRGAHGLQLQLNKGLGLSFCKLAIEAHGGEIWLESTAGKGSTFHFTLPVTD